MTQNLFTFYLSVLKALKHILNLQLRSMRTTILPARVISPAALAHILPHVLPFHIQRINSPYLILILQLAVQYDFKRPEVLRYWQSSLWVVFI